MKLNNTETIINKDLQHVWHPCSRMKDFVDSPPLVVTGAHGSYLDTNQGKLIDGISSWWCKSLGHGHPAVLSAIRAQLEQFEHVMPANTTHPNIVKLAQQLTEISDKQHVYFASDGSSAVEIAIKLAIQATAIKGHPKRNEVVALSNAYHGETLGALSVSDLGLYKQAWSSFGVTCHFLQNVPYLCDDNDPLWQSVDPLWPSILKQLDAVKDNVCAIIVEPVIQGVYGLWPYSPDFLAKLAAYAKQHDIYLIADEIMTGLGRTGKWLACEYAGISPDMICLSKGLTSGSIPLSCVMIDHAIFDLYYHQKDPQFSFLHSHTFGGNPLAVAAACATLQAMKDENINQQAQELGLYMQRCFIDVLNHTGQFVNIRKLGAIVAADFNGENPHHFGPALAKSAQQKGALLRPIGQTLYWMPPLNTSFATIDKLADITAHAIQSVLKDKL